MSKDPRSCYFSLCDREIHVTQWGEPHKPALVMWHGLVRTGRDFDTLARSLAEDYFILAPDTLGRGLSQWAKSPEDEYQIRYYGRLAVALLDLLEIGTTRWVGTSMGGAIGIYLAGGPLKGRISHLVINDIGPEIPSAAIDRIITYVGNPPMFANMMEAESWLRGVYTPFGPLSDHEWRVMAESSVRRMNDGRLTLHYDPGLVRAFAKDGELGNQWSGFDAILAHTLVIHGTQSDLLTDDIATQMTLRGPCAARLDIAEVGHAPALNVPDQIEPIRRFLTKAN